ncbi:hypothetical protein POL68_17290 [Stigmatella sp. ncwal1]|uniref:Uncharacterized protein n=1 Tax=Stigmatella ashevillensis TaxID=2995309 RepID=A0ABT5D981_9BACT|nr:hypothetical protein [Stigmatella ashevillena]MDC0710235.1 hypothetical protein [Stigmatella ashevillena]
MDPVMHLETLSYLLRIRSDMQRRRLRMYIGDIRVERLACFIDGYRACLRANGSESDEYERFTDWRRDIKQDASGRDWPAEYLLNCHGDHEKAIRKYLDLVAEFIAVKDVAATLQGRDAEATAGRASDAGTLDVLCRVRQELIQGQLAVPLCEASAECFETFVEGCHACLLANGFADDEYGHFFEWLRDVKQEMPGEGWPAKFLRDCHGDHAQAIRKYLDFVAEFLGHRSGRENASR